MILVLITAPVEADESASTGGNVLFMIPPSTPPDVVEELRAALAAQFAGDGARVTFASFDADLGALREQVHRAREYAERYSAQGVFWLDSQNEADWLLYLAEPSGERVLVRRIELATNSTAAAVEAVSVITHRSATALAKGQTIGMRPVVLAETESSAATEPPPPPPVVTRFVPPAPPAPPRTAPQPDSRSGEARLRLGYRGVTFAREVPWQSGVSISGGYLAPAGFYGGAGVILHPVVTVDDALAAFEVRRLPFELTLGWRLRFGRVGLGAQVVTSADVTRRTTAASEEGLEGAPSDQRVVFGVSPRLAVDVGLTSAAGLYVESGIEAPLNGFDYVAVVDDQTRSLLAPRPVRLVLDVGVTFSL